MILTLSGSWRVDPKGPLRESDDAEDMWSLINSVASIMSGSALSPWFVGESSDGETAVSGNSDSLVLELYSSGGPVMHYFPSFMLATAIGLEKAYEEVKLSRISVELHPGERIVSIVEPWWGNFFNQADANATWGLTVSPRNSQLARDASVALPTLFKNDNGDLESVSWGLMEAAALIAIFTEGNSRWEKITIDCEELGQW